MAYVPKALDAAQQEEVLDAWDDYMQGKISETPSDMAQIGRLAAVRAILAEPPTERAPKKTVKGKATKGPVA